jgi:hypothetical protein
MKQAIATLATLAGIMGACSGCALISPVQPWEKGTLARTDMLIEGDTLGSRFDEHIYSSREAASGGSGVGGGGCGCN